MNGSHALFAYAYNYAYLYCYYAKVSAVCAAKMQSV